MAIVGTERHLVTGGAGFIGSHIARALLGRGERVTVLDDLSTGNLRRIEGLRGDIRFIEGDVRSRDDVESAMHDAKTVIHQAAVVSVPESVHDPMRCVSVNDVGTLQLLLASKAKGIRRFILAASAAAYGDTPTLPKREEMQPKPRSPYAASKVAAEHHLQTFAHLHGMGTISLRYFNVYGPDQDVRSAYASVIPKFVTQFLAGETPTIFGDGSQTRDFCFVGDVVAANLAALECPEPKGEVVNIGTGVSCSVSALFQLLCRELRQSHIPRFHGVRDGDVLHSVADIALASRLLGYQPRISIEEGLKRTLSFYRQAASAGHTP